MKTFKTLVVSFLIASSALVGCSKSDDNNNTTPKTDNNSVVGTWIATRQEQLDADGKVVEAYDYQSTEGCNDYVEYVVDGNGISVYYDTEGSNNCVERKNPFTWKVEGDKLILTGTGENQFVSNFTFKRNNDVLETARPINKDEELDYEPNITNFRYYFRLKK